MLRQGLLLASLCSANAAIGWVRGGGEGRLCAGVEESCDSIASCTMTAYGLCSEGDTPSSTEYLTSEFIGLAFVKEGYLTDETKMRVVEADDTQTNGYRDFKAGETMPNGAEYAFTMTGGRFGDMSDVGGYIGIASYLNTGDVDIETNSAKIYTSDDENTARQDNGNGDDGAPLGPMEVCITGVKSGACGDDRTFSPGEYKFSIFGWTKGTNYPPAKGEYGFPDYTHLGVRMKLKANGFEVDALHINGDKTLEDIGSTDVYSISLTAGNETLNIAFPKKYNYGDVLSGAVDVPDGTKTVGIKVSDAAIAGEQSIYIDYLFEEKDINTALRYFIYDPDVSVGAAEDGDFSSALSFSGIAAALLATAALMWA